MSKWGWDLKWPEPMESALRELWPGDLSCSGIASEMGRRFRVTMTKSMVCGKATRLKLGHRPTSFGNTSKADDTAVRRIRKLQTDGLSQLNIAEVTGLSRNTISQAAPVRGRRAPVFTLAPAPVPTNVVVFPSVSCCQFPLWGHKERPKFGRDGMPLFCNATTGDGPYCAKHKRKVYRGWDEVA